MKSNSKVPNQICLPESKRAGLKPIEVHESTEMLWCTPATTTSGSTEAMRCSSSGLLRSACKNRAWWMAFCLALARASATALLTDSTPVTALHCAARLSAMVPVPVYRSSKCCARLLDSPAAKEGLINIVNQCAEHVFLHIYLPPCSQI